MLDETIQARQTALLIVDLQNDFLHERGAYARAGQSAPQLAALPARVLPLAKALKDKGGMVAACRFTLWPDANGDPMVASHLRELRPFLGGSDFAPDSWGRQIVDPLRELADVSVDKVAYSAFYSTQLEWVLRHAGITNLAVAGIVTQGGVASTVRDAHVRELHAIVLTDGCATFDDTVHRTAIADMGSIAQLCDCKSLISRLR